jgi:hypothetical protein
MVKTMDIDEIDGGERTAAQQAKDNEYARVRDISFDAIRKHVPCDKPPMSYGCERAHCVCADAACEIAHEMTKHLPE